MSAPIDAAAVIVGLTRRAGEFAARAFVHGRRVGNEYTIGDFSDRAGRAIIFAVDGPTAGRWRDVRNGREGDVLDFVAAALFAGDREKAFAWSAAWLGLDATRTVERADTIFAEALAARAGLRHGQPANEAQRALLRDQAHRLWSEALPDLAGTPAAAYLATHGIDLRRTGPIPALRFQPALAYPDSELRMPALVAAASDEAGQFVAAVRLYLRQDPVDGSVTRARVAAPVLPLGAIAGGAVRLGSELADGWTVTVALEDALRLHGARPGERILAAIDAGNLRRLHIPVGLCRLRVSSPWVPAGTREARQLFGAMERWRRGFAGRIEFETIEAATRRAVA
jgi:hypothetical protein